MIQPVIVRKSIPIAVITLLLALVPAVVAVGSLYAFSRGYGVDFDTSFVFLAVVVATLSIVFHRPFSQDMSDLLSPRLPLTVSIVVRWMIMISTLLVIGYITKLSSEFSRRVLVSWALVTPVVIVPVTLILHEILRRMLFSPSNARKVVFVGYNQASRTLAERLGANADLCMSVTGFFDDRSAERLGAPAEARLLGRLPELASFVKAHGVDIIFVALPIRHLPRVMDLLDELRDTTASIYYVPDVFVFDLIQARTGEILGIPVVAMCETPFYGFRGLAKRMADIFFAFTICLLLSPLLLAIALLIRMTSHGPAIFKQRRYGLDGREIMVYKFRTMNVIEDGPHIMQATQQDVRITPMGRFLRRYSLDELPQLINVIQGRMSLVGPRPHAVAHNEMYRKLIKGYMMRHKVLPGITGLAQVSGFRGETKNLQQMEARVQYDLEYLRNWSVLLDMKIIFRTAVRIFTDRDVY